MRRLLWTVGLILAVFATACGRETATPIPTAPPFPTAEAQLNGPLIVFYSERDGGGYSRMQPDGSDLRPLDMPDLPAGQKPGDLKWLPGLKAFAAKFTDSIGPDLYLLDARGKILQRLTRSNDTEGQVDYSSQNGLLAYECILQDIDLCVIWPDGRNPANLTLMESRDVNPQWSPDGKQLLFVSNYSGLSAPWVVNADGTNKTNLSPGVQSPEAAPVWSPDGQKIALASQRDLNWEIYVINADGSGAVNLTQSPGQDTQPVWSPDGQWLAFRSNREGGNDVYIVPAAGGPALNVTNTPGAQELKYLWYPDGQQLLVVAEVGDQTDLLAVQRDGSGARNLTQSPESENDPQWIP